MPFVQPKPVTALAAKEIMKHLPGHPLLQAAPARLIRPVGKFWLITRAGMVGKVVLIIEAKGLAEEQCQEGKRGAGEN